jgi:predicted nucleic acid-binding protein
MQKLKLVIDTNIFIKKFFFESKYYHCKTLLDIITNNENIDLVFTQDTIGELFYVSKLMINNINNMNYEDGLELINKISKIFYDSIIVNTLNTIAPKCNDEFDDMFLKCYVESNADYILTDDFKSGMNKIKNINVLESIKFIQMVSKGEFEEVGVTL